MTVNRGRLFWGVLLVTLGAIPLADQAGWVDARGVEVWRLWPVALIAIGVAIIAARSRLAVAAIVAAGLVAGASVGAALTYGGWGIGFVECAAGGELQRVTDGGEVGTDARVQVVLNCGSAEVETAAGDRWALEADYRREPPSVEITSRSVVVRAPDQAGRQEWRLTIPESVAELDVQASAGDARIDVSGAEELVVTAEVNAGSLRIVADDATLRELDVQANAGTAALVLGGDTTGSLAANAGSIELCVPADANLRFELDDNFAFGTNLESQGLERAGDVWTRPGGGPTIELRVEGNAGSFNVNPAGSCQ